MQTLIVKTESETAAKFLLAFLKNVRMVKSVTLRRDESTRPNDSPDGRETGVANEPAEEYNWINPSRPATDEEIEQMLNECEKSPLLSSKEAKERSMKKLKEWRVKK